MTKHRNVSIAQRASEIFGETQGDQLPDDVAGPVAVIPIEPCVNIVRHGQSGTTLTLYTTPTDKDFYLTQASLDWVKDATSTNQNVAVEIRLDNGVARYICNMGANSLTACDKNIVANITRPIKLDRGSAIRLINGVGGGTTLSTGMIAGYTQEVKR